MPRIKRDFSLTATDDAHLEKLSLSWRNILFAAGNGLSYGRIASDMSLPIGTVRSRLNRARNKIVALRAKAEVSS